MTTGAIPDPPEPERRPYVLEAHGDRRVDDWHWLRDRDDPAVLAHLAAENAYADAVLARLDPRRDRLYEEMRARILETDLSVPVRRGPWWYYQRTETGRSYPVHCRRPAAGEDPPLDPGPVPEERVLLDENELATTHEYLEVANLTVSPDHRWLAYATDTTGGELFDLRFRHLDGVAGADPATAGAPVVTETVPSTYYGLAWANDSATVFYTRVDDAMRPHQLWRHRLGTNPADDELVLQEDDERFTLSVGRTKDGAYVGVGIHSRMTSEWWVVPADRPDSPPGLVAPRRPGVEYSIEHHRAGGGAGWFVMVSNDGAEDFRALAAPADAVLAGPAGAVLAGPAGGEPAPLPVAGTWHELVPHRPGTRLEDVDVFDGWLVAAERVGGEPVLRVIGIPDGGIGALVGSDVVAASWLVPAPEGPAVTWAGPNPEPGSASLRIEQTSLVEPRTVSDVSLADRTRTVRKRQPVLGGYDPDRFRTYRMWATAPDGVAVPISVVHRADLRGEPDAPPTDPAPCLLYGYGAYEISIDPVFSSLRLSLLERGVVFAIAHVRGGGELGRRWYLDGKESNKPHTFSDFIACARHLVDVGITAPDRLAARGGSAGGLLMGAVVNQVPDLFAAVVAEVPFVDCLTTMLDETLPLTVGEFEEWGDPVRDPAAYAVIKSYSPYDNVAPARLPRMYVTAGLNDPRVGYWEPAKWAAKLRSVDPAARITLRTELSAGHAGPSGRYETWRDEARIAAWLLDALGVEDETSPLSRPPASAG